MAIFEGGCQCGAVRYEVTMEGLFAYACHCLECQKQSASAFGISVPARSEHFRLDGAVQPYRRATGSGSHMDCWFCQTCGTRLYHQPVNESDWVSIKGGTFDRSDLVNPAAHIWVKRKRPWVLLPPDIAVCETEPDDFGTWRRALMSASD